MRMRMGQGRGAPLHFCELVPITDIYYYLFHAAVADSCWTAYVIAIPRLGPCVELTFIFLYKPHLRFF